MAKALVTNQADDRRIKLTLGDALAIAAIIFAAGGGWVTLHYVERDVDRLSGEITNLGADLRNTHDQVIRLDEKLKYLSPKKEADGKQPE